MNRSAQKQVGTKLIGGVVSLVGCILIGYGPQALGAGYLSDANGCQAFNPSPVVGEAITWTGACKDTFLDGPGTLSWTVNGEPDGSTTGNFVKGKIEGQGVRLSKSGARYEGNFSDDEFNGQGKFTYPNGAVYVGAWVKGHREGHGVVTFASGERYDGEFKYGFVGQGTLSYANGARLTGTFSGWPDDDAVLTEANGSVFKGVFLGRGVGKSGEKLWQDALTQQLNAGLSSDSHSAARGPVTGLLKVTFSADGSAASFALEGSSGSAELDDQVLALAKEAKNLPPFPSPDRAAVMIFADSVKGSAVAAPGGGQAPTTYVMKNNGGTGSMMARNQTEGLRIDPDKSYPDLSPAEKQLVKSRYANMPADDEPPYPIDGPAKLYRGTSEIARRYQPEGQLSLVVDIDAKGQATGVSVLSNPSQDFVKDVATLLMLQKYKPAVCHGQPCKMQFPFVLNYVGRASRMNQ